MLRLGMLADDFRYPELQDSDVKPFDAFSSDDLMIGSSAKDRKQVREENRREQRSKRGRHSQSWIWENFNFKGGDIGKVKLKRYFVAGGVVSL